MASPRTRGWTPYDRIGDASGRGFHAHAGMDPIDGAAFNLAEGLPRARGDGPQWALA